LEFAIDLDLRIFCCFRQVWIKLMKEVNDVQH